MMNDLQIWQTARVLVREFGYAAEHEAARRHEYAIEIGNVSITRDWSEIRIAVLKLLSRKQATAP